MKVVVKRTSQKVLKMTVDSSGTLQVVANRRLSLDKIKSIVESKRDWIFAQLQAVGAVAANAARASDDVQPQPYGKLLTEMFLGKSCLLNGDVFSVVPTVENKCYLDGTSVYLPEKHFANKEARLKALKAYIKKLALQNVADEVSKFGCNASLCPTRIEFRAVSVGWVRCTKPAERVVSLDYRVFQLPERLRRYVIVHAFAHFTNDGHDADFWNTVSNYLPRYRTAAEELKQFEFLKEI